MIEFQGYKWVVVAVVFFEILAILFLHRRKPLLAGYITIVSLLLKGQYIFIGYPIYAWLLAPFLGLLYLQRGSTKSGLITGGNTLNKLKLFLTIFFLYTFLFSIMMWVMIVFGIDNLGSEFISLSRVFTQTIYFLLWFGLFFFGVKVGRYMSIAILLRFMVLLATVVSFFAIIQVLAFNLLGINFFPIIGSDNTLRSVYILDSTFRATSFCGEPKHLGITMALGIISLFIMRIFRIPVGKYWFYKFVMMIIALFFSLSTTGFYLTFSIIGMLSLFFIRRLKKTDIVLVVLIAAIGIYQISVLSDEFISSLLSQVSKGSVEVQDQSVFLALLNNPLFILTGTGLGNIHIYAVNYLPIDFPLFRDQAYKANSGLFFILGDSGLIGLLLLVTAHAFPMILVYQLRFKLTPVARREANATLAFLITSFIAFLLRFNELHFLILGFSFAILANTRKSAEISKITTN